MREEEEKILVYGNIVVAHSRANIGTGRANLLDMEVWFWHSVARPCHIGTGRAKVLDVLGSIFFVSLNHTWTITYKTTKNKQNKSN